MNYILDANIDTVDEYTTISIRTGRSGEQTL